MRTRLKNSYPLYCYCPSDIFILEREKRNYYWENGPLRWARKYDINLGWFLPEIFTYTSKRRGKKVEIRKRKKSSIEFSKRDMCAVLFTCEVVACFSSRIMKFDMSYWKVIMRMLFVVYCEVDFSLKYFEIIIY